MAALPPYALEVSPESSLQFSITQHPQGDGDENNASKCVLTLRHTGATRESLAFKVSCRDAFCDVICSFEGALAAAVVERPKYLLGKG